MKFLLPLGLAASAAASGLRPAGSDGWSDLSTTWMAWLDVPTSQADAEAAGWASLMGCADGAPGAVYADDGDLSTMPFYDEASGALAGVILGLADPGASSQQDPFLPYTSPAGDSFWGVTAHFSEADACSTSADSKGDFGDHVLRFANADGSFVEPPLTEDTDALAALGWDKGACFVTMGRHYWNSGDSDPVGPDSDCEKLNPIFFLYNGGELNAFGIAMSHSDRPDAPGDRWEHPGGSVLNMFFGGDQMPTCLPDQGTLSTQHVYLQASGLFHNYC